MNSTPSLSAYHYEIESAKTRPEEDWVLRLFKNGDEIGGGSYARFDRALSEAKEWLCVVGEPGKPAAAIKITTPPAPFASAGKTVWERPQALPN